MEEGAGRFVPIPTLFWAKEGEAKNRTIPAITLLIR
jgi:hypothetical protein